MNQGNGISTILFYIQPSERERDRGDGMWADAWMGKRKLGKAGRLTSCSETETVKQKGGQMRGWVKESGDRQTPC